AAAQPDIQTHAPAVGRAHKHEAGRATENALTVSIPDHVNILHINKGAFKKSHGGHIRSTRTFPSDVTGADRSTFIRVRPRIWQGGLRTYAVGPALPLRSEWNSPAWRWF